MRKFFQAGSWVLLSNTISKILSFLILGFLARFLDPRGIGIYNAIITSANSTNQISQMGTSIVLQRTGARLQVLGLKRVSTRFTIIVFIQLVVNVVFAALFLIHKDYFFTLFLDNEGTISFIFFISSIVVLQVISQLPLTLLMGLGEFKSYSLRMMLCNLITMLTLIPAIIISKNKLEGALYGLSISFFINAIITWLILNTFLKKYKIRMVLSRVKKEMREIFQEGFLYYVGNTLLGAILNVVILGLFLRNIGVEEYGYLRIAGSLIAILGIIPISLKPVTITFLSSSKESDEVKIKSLQLRYIISVSLIISILLVLFIEPIVFILFGQEYTSGSPIYIFLILSQLLILSSSLFSNFLVAKGYTTYIGIYTSIGVVIQILLSFYLIPKVGLLGFFISHLTGYGIGFFFLLYKEFSINDYPDKRYLINLSFICIIYIGLTIYLVITANLILNIIASVILVFAYVIIFYFFVMLKEEKTYINHITKGYLKLR